MSMTKPGLDASMRYVVFLNRADEAAGLVQLARKTRVDALPNGVYALGAADLKYLNDLNLMYRFATESEVGIAAERIRVGARPNSHAQAEGFGVSGARSRFGSR